MTLREMKNIKRNNQITRVITHRDYNLFCREQGTQEGVVGEAKLEEALEIEVRMNEADAVYESLRHIRFIEIYDYCFRRNCRGYSFSKFWDKISEEV